jgi:hypothetical protein
MGAHLCGLWDLMWYRCIRSRREGWSGRSRHASLSPFALHFHSFGVRTFATDVVWRRSFRSGCIGCVCIDWRSGGCGFAVRSRCLRWRWRRHLRTGRSIGTSWLRVCCIICRRRRRGRRSRGRSWILILAHDPFKIGEHSPLLIVRKVQLRRPITLKLRNPLHTLLEHILLLFV